MVTAMIGDGARPQLRGSRFADIRSFESIDSTNRHLLALARAGAPDGVVVVAELQTQGRGRMGRTWVAPAGTSLLVSALLRANLAGDQLPLAGMAMGLAVADACRDEAGVGISLKWPNDVADGGRKLAGVLVEAHLDGPGAPGVVLGAGVNVNWPPAAGMTGELDDAAVSLGHGAAVSLGHGAAVSLRELAGHPIDRDQLLAALLRSLERRCATLATSAGQRAQALEYRRRCATLGQVVRVELSGETFTGMAVDINAEGHLLVEVGVCLRSVSSGDVIHIRPIGTGS